MTTQFQIREDTTEPINITLKSNGSAADISGYSSVSIFLRSVDNPTVGVEHDTVDGNVVIVSAAAGTITVQFDENDLLNSMSPYSGYILVVDGTGNRSTFPEGDEFLFIVGERYTDDN